MSTKPHIARYTFLLMIIAALTAFEVFNYSTTEFALGDLLGTMLFAGLKWSTILALAFCLIDFAGIARLFNPDREGREPTEISWLFAAWILAAIMNAGLTWWGVSIALYNHTSQGAVFMNQASIQRFAPIFVAISVLLLRVMIIRTLTLAVERLYKPAPEKNRAQLAQEKYFQSQKKDQKKSWNPFSKGKEENFIPVEKDEPKKG